MGEQMDLKDFVRDTLLSITEGVSEAQAKSKLFIAPGTVEGKANLEPQNVTFDVLVVTGIEAGAGIKVFAFGDASTSGSSEKTHRVQFEVPVYFQAPTPISPFFEDSSVSAQLLRGPKKFVGPE